MLLNNYTNEKMIELSISFKDNKVRVAKIPNDTTLMTRPNEIMRLLNDEIILVKPRLKRSDSTTRKIRTKIKITILKKSENNKAESKRKGNNGLF